MKRHSTKLAVYLLNFCLFCGSVAAVDVEFYSLSSTVTDSSKIQMTEDLFFTQLLSLQQYKIVDKRPTSYTGIPANPSQDTMVFYGELQENGSSWTCTLHLEQPHLNKKAQVTGSYDSYFKILSEAKSSISQLFANLEAPSTAATASHKQTAPAGIPTFDSLSGTWIGEASINKIVLLRGGRGFVIFNNGASMNISVEIQGHTIICTQAAKSNASFFPDLPREVALVAAMNAQPITWTMTLSNTGTMTGTKRSLLAVMDSGTAVGAEMGITEVTWIRQQ